MNVLVIKILAMGLTLGQLFTKPIEQFKVQFNPDADQAQVAELLGEGCKFMVKEFGAEQVDFNFLFSMMIANIKATQEMAAVPAVSEKPLPDKLTTVGLTEHIDVPSIYAAYKQFCKGEKVENSPIKLNEIIAYYNQTLTNLPDHAKLKTLKLPESTLILDRSGARFTEVYADNNRRKWVPISDMPVYLQKAFVAAEDKRFYQHMGLDMRGIIRAFASSMSSKARPQGGSTITQQVVKNLLVGDDLTFERKMREMVVAARLEKIMTKNEILELYLNYVFLGRASWGVQMAAQSYFGKNVDQLSVSESSVLAALTRGPNFYHPTLHADRLEERRAYVLSRMKEDGTLQEASLQQALADKPKFIEFESPRTRSAFYFLDELQRDARKVAKINSFTTASYVVRSTINRDLQKSAERALQDGLAEYEARAGRTDDFEIEGSLAVEIEKYKTTWQEALPEYHGKLWDIQWPLAVVIKKAHSGAVKLGLPDGREATLTGAGSKVIRSLKLYDLLRVQINEGSRALTASVRLPPNVQGAIVVLETKTGRVLAMSGGFSYAASQLNRATRTERQPGSTLKPFIYLSALELGFQPNTYIPDSPISLAPINRGGKWYSPHNFDGGNRGLVTIRRAVELSLNLPTVRLMSEMGRTPSEGLDFIQGVTQELGLYRQPLRYYPFVLGAQPTRLIDMAVAYATIANIGLKPTPHLIDSIEQDGKLIYERPRFDLQKIPSVDRISFYQIRHILEGSVERGTAVKLKDLAGFVAGKTGTTNNTNDAWFVGFTNDLVVATWVGYDNRHIEASLGSKFTGSRAALPIAEKVIRDSFKIYKDKEPLAGPPAEIQAQIVTYPIDVYTGRFNEGRYPEVFRTDRTGVAKNTVMSLLHGNEVNLGIEQMSQGGEDEQGYEDNYAPRDRGRQSQNSDPAYAPGAEDMNDLWNRRGRRMDNFLTNPPYQR